MRQNKLVLFSLFPLTVIALLLAWVLDSSGYSFWSNVMLGIFGSSLLTVLVSGINYYTERRRILKAFWTAGHKAARNLNRYPICGTISEKADAIILMNEFDFEALRDAYSEINFIFNNKRLKKRIFDELYRPLEDAQGIVRNSADEITRLRRDIPDKPQVLEDYVKAVDDVLIETKEYACNDNTLTIPCTSNKIFAPCYERFNGFYWKIMYPLRKQEEEESAD